MTDEQILKIAGETLKYQEESPEVSGVLDFARRLLAAQEAQEPVAEVTVTNAAVAWSAFHKDKFPLGVHKLYLHPAPIPEGMVLVPKEPTAAIKQAMLDCESGDYSVLGAWDMILAAAQGEK